MYNLGSTADQYLSPALEAIAERLSCSESLAGVTLLALGNGAPDVFAAYSASSGGDGGDITFTVSCLMGSAFFITSVVMYLSVNGAEVVDDTKKIRVTKRFFLRDLIFYMLATVYLLFVIIFIGKITIVITIGFLALYMIFVVTVVVQSKMKGSNEEEDQQDRQDAQKALDFTEMIHQKRDAAASLAQGLRRQNTKGEDSVNLSKKLGLTKKLTMKMIDDEQQDGANSLQVPGMLIQRRQTARSKKSMRKAKDKNPMAEPLNNNINEQDSSIENSQAQLQNTVDYQEEDTIKVSHGKIVKNEEDDDDHIQVV